MSSRAQHLRRLAAAFAAGAFSDEDELVSRARPLVGDLRKARWLKPLAKLLSAEFGTKPRPTEHRIADRIARHPAFIKAWTSGRGRILPPTAEARMAPAPGAPQSWLIPQIPTISDLAKLLQLHPDDLGWLITPGCTEHYLHRWHSKPKTDGSRLIEIPKPLLKIAQTGILRQILEAIPPHEAASGFRRGKSIRDFVAPHSGSELLLRMDLQDFFPSIGSARVMRLFLTAGYPERVSRALSQLATTSAPASTLRQRKLTWPERKRLAAPHLPQGAPTSPALANLCAFRLDCRLAGLARACGASYTRYADDLLFSGDTTFARQAKRFQSATAAIILEEGFHPNHRKTRLIHSSQKQAAAGLVLNEKPNISRRDYDRLKAILTNCVRHGPASQNRAGHPDFCAHLRGKIAWVQSIHSEHGAKLQRIFDDISWN